MKLIRNLIAEEGLLEGKDIVYLTEPRQKALALASKLMEESCELYMELKSKNIDKEALLDEIIDVQDVTTTILQMLNITFEELNDAAEAKRKKKGVFNHFTFFMGKDR